MSTGESALTFILHLRTFFTRRESRHGEIASASDCKQSYEVILFIICWQLASAAPVRTTNCRLEARKAAFYTRYIMDITKKIRENIIEMISKSTLEDSTKFLVSGLLGFQDD